MLIKFIVLVMLFSLSILSVLTGCDSLQPEIRWETYENQFIQMEYPASWSYEEVEAQGLIAVKFEEEGKDFVFEMSISGIENWLEEEEKLEMMQALAIEQSEEEGFEITKNKEIEIDSYPGIKIVDHKEDRGTRKTVATVFSYHQLAINFAGTTEAYDEQEDIVEEMIESIEVIVN
ncbi:PsbP-related protein [Isachenkonia alkalipeptolytica]|uniref:Uncharacterized protein n=1 Tax=Isachenkonia alkalipeptolytica TaxID=2565777 RepID=A0AA43XM55_9CLOT|nr:PsbP-related protein [Isachenkonia alkalipeptolytica]NBG88475.1 hypothetical protein [Isachenkonia alkalipeptolytica]